MDKQHIVQQLDRVEAEIYRQYRALERTRLELQQEWRVLPDGTMWTPEKHEASRYSTMGPVVSVVAHNVRILEAAIAGVEKAREVGYTIHKAADVAGHVVRALREAGHIL